MQLRAWEERLGFSEEGRGKASLRTGWKFQREQEKGIRKAKVQLQNINYFKQKRGSKLLLFA